MKKSFRVISIISAVALMGSLFAGCGDSKENSSASTATASASTAAATSSQATPVEKTKITVWSSSRHDMDIRKAQIDEYNKANTDGIEISYEVKQDNYADVLRLAYSSANAPDVHTELPGTLMNSAIKSGWLRPLDESIVKEYSELFLPGSLKPQVTDGKVYNVAVAMNTFKFIWNKDLFKEAGLDPANPPKTWTEVREYAKTITQKGNGKKFGFALPFKDESIVMQYTILPMWASGQHSVQGFLPKTGAYDFSGSKQILKLYQDMKKDGSLFPTPDTLTNDAARAQFSEGNVGMMLGATWDVGVFNDQFPAKIDWGVADYPVFEGTKGGYPAAIAGGFMMNASTEAKDKQLTVWKWLISEEVLKKLSLEGKGPYSLKSVNKPEFMNNTKKGAVEFSVATAPIITINTPVYNPNSLIKPEGDNYLKTMTAIIVAGLDIDKTIEDLNTRYNNALKKVESEGTDISKFKIADYNPLTYVSK